MSSGSGESSDTLNSEDEFEDNLPGTSDGNIVINESDAASAFNVGVADDPSSPWTHFPLFDVMRDRDPNLLGEIFLHGETFACTCVTCCYDEVAHWRKSFHYSKVW